MKSARLALSVAAALLGMAAAHYKTGVAPVCTSVKSATKSEADCDNLIAGMCAQAEGCDYFEDLFDQLLALQKEAADLRALLPTAARYQGANAGLISVGGGTVANALVQVTSFPSATSDVAPRGVETVEVFFTVTSSIDAKALIPWSTLTNGEYTPGGSFEEGAGRVRCGVEMGYGGGVDATHVQSDLAGSGFVTYAKADGSGITLETDQLPVVNNFDSSKNVWPLGQYSCVLILQRA